MCIYLSINRTTCSDDIVILLDITGVSVITLSFWANVSLKIHNLDKAGLLPQSVVNVCFFFFFNLQISDSHKAKTFLQGGHIPAK